MELSVREARAQFAHALSAAERGERVTITKNGKPIAELGPPIDHARSDDESFWDRLDRTCRELGFADRPPDPRSDEEWLADFNDGAATRELFGDDFYDDSPIERTR